MQTNSNPWREIKQYVRVEKQQKPINMYDSKYVARLIQNSFASDKPPPVNPQLTPQPVCSCTCQARRCFDSRPMNVQRTIQI